MTGALWLGGISAAVVAAAAWFWGQAHGYRRGLQARPTLIDPIAKFLKGTDTKRARAARDAQEDGADALLRKHDALRPPEVVEAERTGAKRLPKAKAPSRPKRQARAAGKPRPKPRTPKKAKGPGRPAVKARKAPTKGRRGRGS